MLKILCPWHLNNAKAAGLGETCPKKIFSSTLLFQCIQKYCNCAENVSHNRSMESFVPGAIEWHVVELKSVQGEPRLHKALFQVLVNSMHKTVHHGAPHVIRLE